MDDLNLDCYSRFFNVKLDGQTGTILLENPVGRQLFNSAEELQRTVAAIYGTSKKLSSSEGKVQPLPFDGMDSLHGKTIYLV